MKHSCDPCFFIIFFSALFRGFGNIMPKPVGVAVCLFVDAFSPNILAKPVRAVAEPSVGLFFLNFSTQMGQMHPGLSVVVIRL